MSILLKRGESVTLTATGTLRKDPAPVRRIWDDRFDKNDLTGLEWALRLREYGCLAVGVECHCEEDGTPCVYTELPD